MQYSQEHLKTMVYAKFGGQTECIMGNSKIVNDMQTYTSLGLLNLYYLRKWRGGEKETNYYSTGELGMYDIMT